MGSSEVTIKRDIPFAEREQRKLLCDIYQPPAARAKGVGIVHIHGGGGTGGSRDGARLAASLAESGYVSVAMQYRLAQEALWPAQLDDVNACIDWVKRNAFDLGITSSRIALLGYSIGAQFGIIAAGGAEAGIAACVCLYPSGRDDNGSANVLGTERAERELDSLDPLAYVHSEFPPTQLFHGNADMVVDVQSSFELYRALSGVGVAVELHIMEGVNHGFEGYPEFAVPSVALIDLFLERHVVNPRSYRDRPSRR